MSVGLHQRPESNCASCWEPETGQRSVSALRRDHRNRCFHPEYRFVLPCRRNSLAIAAPSWQAWLHTATLTGCFASRQLDRRHARSEPPRFGARWRNRESSDGLSGSFGREGTTDNPSKAATLTDDELKAITTDALDKLAALLDEGRATSSPRCSRPWRGSSSWHNVALIASQRPTATRVAGLQAWRTMNRFVRKGEKDISDSGANRPTRCGGRKRQRANHSWVPRGMRVRWIISGFGSRAVRHRMSPCRSSTSTSRPIRTDPRRRSDHAPVPTINDFLSYLEQCARSPYTVRAYARGLAPIRRLALRGGGVTSTHATRPVIK